jgi:drug/metabolite transporter (DMT)-like permease
MNRTASLYILLAFTILIWGNSFIVVDIAIRDGSSPVLIGMGRLLLASGIFGMYVIRKRPKAPAGKDLWRFGYLAFVGIGVYYVLQYYGVKLAGPAITAILVTLLSPLMIFLMSFFKFNERLSTRQGMGVATAVIGAFLVITRGTLSFVSNWTNLLGGLFGAVCAILWALYTVGGKTVLKTHDALPSTAYLTLIGTLMMVPFAVVDAKLNHPVVTFSFFVAVAYLGVLCTVVGHFLWFRVLGELTASSTGSFLFLEPVVTVAFAWIILGQWIGWTACFGGLLVLMGVALISRG